MQRLQRQLTRPLPENYNEGLLRIDGWKMYSFKKFLFNPPTNNHYKMAGHVAPISRDFSLNQPRKNGVVHVIL